MIRAVVYISMGYTRSILAAEICWTGWPASWYSPDAFWVQQAAVDVVFRQFGQFGTLVVVLHWLGAGLGVA